MPGMELDSAMTMDVEHSHPIAQVAPLTLIQQIQLIDLLFKYFEGSEWKGTLSNISKDAFVMDTADNEQGCM
jgi:hypothetical protein